MTLLSERFCEICGAPIKIQCIIETRSFIIKNGEIKSIGGPIKSHIDFLCSKKACHNIGDSKDFTIWRKKVAIAFYQDKKIYRGV